jgi:hypothetical protein
MKFIYFFICLIVLEQQQSAQVHFFDYFTLERLRFDYVVAGCDTSQKLFEYRFYREPIWGGLQINLIDTFLFGDMLLEVYDSLSGKLIYSKGYSTLFKEWQTTEEAKQGERAFFESVEMPFPSNTIYIKIYDREAGLVFNELYSAYLNPTIASIAVQKQPRYAEVKSVRTSGSPSDKVDVVFVAEGYTMNQHDKFFSDVVRFDSVFFDWDPYKNFSSSFNIYAVFAPSEDSGTDNPTDTTWVNTVLESNLNTFNSERYLTVSDIPRLRNIVSGVPYDQICIIVNSDIYGGGGIFNLYTIFTSDNQYSEFLFHHEFGHAFVCLADEYYTSDVSYTEMIDLKVEPYQPNITTSVDFSKKWKVLIADSIPQPTPDSAYYENVTGLFEGAAYCAKGIYRSSRDCSMKSIRNNAFCRVCKEAIIKKIQFTGMGE